MKKTIFASCLMWVSLTLCAKPIEYFLPEGEMFDASIPSPEAVLGQQLGQRHLRHGQILSYLNMLASSRPEAKLIDYGMTNEGRRLVLLAISSSENISKLESLKTDRKVLKIWNGFSVHGDEASGSNASVLYAWYLLATNNPSIKETLKNTVVLIDPSINPDGLSRFTTYVNNHRSLSTVSDANDMAHLEPWPTGRTNHYWFDLNRDWLLLTQTESKGRIKMFHQWQPHVLTDHHEMGSSASFFFQPGVPSRKNPLISSTNLDLTNKLARFHARALDEAGQFYYSKESFDDFYPGKGSTYPDLQGSVGILFEQSSANGGVIDTSNGQRSLAAGIKNQFLTALSTLQGAKEHRAELLAYKNEFFDKAMSAAAKLSTEGYVLDISHNAWKAEKLTEFLDMHQIEYGYLNNNKNIKDHEFKKDQAIYLSLNQPQTTLIQSLFNTDTSFNDNTFYDVSAWHLGMAWGLPWAAVNNPLSTHKKSVSSKPQNVYQKNAIAYLFDWETGNAPAALQYLSQQYEGVLLSSKSLHVSGVSVPAGSFILPTGQNINQDKLFAVLSTISDAFKVKWYPVTTALAETGVDLGSPNVQQFKPVKVMMLVGEGVDAYQAGSLWHLFDTQVYVPLSKVRVKDFGSVNLNDYSHIIMPNGRYQHELSEKRTQRLKHWIEEGGHLIALQSSANWVEKELQKTEKESATKEPTVTEKDSMDEAEIVRKKYADYSSDAAEKVLGGAIVSADADLTHPLAFGTNNAVQYVLMKGQSVLEPAQQSYNTPLQVSEQARAAGYVSDYWLEKINKAPLVVADKTGKGSVIKFGFNPNFRAFWLGTQRWMINAVYMTELIQRTR
jgi:hypothetical protein